MRKKKKEPGPPSAPGWNAITRACERAYPGQTNPKHYASLIKWRFGGNGPLDGVSIYDGGDCWHFVTYGLSELYEKETADPAVSGYGMEFTLRLKKGCYQDEEAELKGICGILQSIARATFTKGELFLPWEYLYTGQKEGFDVRGASRLTGFFTIPDPLLPAIDTPNGRVEFVEFVGAADEELRAVMEGAPGVKELFERLGTDITDLKRAPALFRQS